MEPGKTPQSEAQLLGSMMLSLFPATDSTKGTPRDPACISAIKEIIPDRWYFSSGENQILYDLIIDLHKTGKSIDLILVENALKERKLLTAVGGMDYLVSILDSTATAANALYHAAQVKGDYLQRQLSGIKDSITTVLAGEGSAKEKINAISKDMADLRAQAGDDENKGNGLLCAADIQEQRLDWLWPQRIPAGMLSLLVGDPDVGKSYLSLFIAATVSTGRPWPDGTDSTPGAVLLLADEDDPAKTIKPRLAAQTADMSRVFFAHEIFGADTAFDMSRADHLHKLEGIIRETRAALILLDPITAYLGAVNANSNSEVRAVLGPFVRLLGRYNTTAIGLSHLNKKADLEVKYRTLGSMAFSAQARSVWGVIKDKDDETGDARIFSPVKSNLSRKKSGLSFTIDSNQAVIFDNEAVHESIDDSLRESPKMDEACDFLREILSPPGKQLEQRYIEQQANDQGIVNATLRRAKKRIKVYSVPIINGEEKCWFWTIHS